MSNDDPSGSMNSRLDDPEVRRRVLRMLVFLAPFSFVGCLLLARITGADFHYALIIAAVGCAMCLATGVMIYFLGSKARWVMFAILALGVLTKHH